MMNHFKPDDHELLAFTTTIGGMKQIPHPNIPMKSF